ncbi:MAG TPA: trypsin-like peptidase domain-containing protein [Acidimicrobiales bacterium]|nr:trypsin-like peptidase domain-containing protein [Acidimicrobiales bacterium]
MASHPIAPIDGPAGRPAPPHVTTTGGAARRPRRWAAVAAAGAAGAVVAGVGVAVFGVREKVVDRPVVERVAVPTASAFGAPTGSDTARGTAAPTVVTVSTDAATGSGVVVRDDGIVVTSAALVPGDRPPTVVLDDGREPGVEVVGTDAATGLAVLDLAGDGYRPSVLADDDLAAGGVAVAVSRPPSGVAHEDGTVGAAERYVGPAGTALDGIEVAGAADQGALGGAVIDEQGAVVGVTTGVDPGQAWYVVPVAVARRVTREIVDTGAAQHCWLGIEGTDAAAETDAEGTTTPQSDDDEASDDEAGDDEASDDAEGSDDGAEGTLVASVVPDSPAAEGGLRPGDRIVALDEQAIADMAALLVALRAYAPGDRVQVEVVRDDGTRVTLLLRLDPAPATTP